MSEWPHHVSTPNSFVYELGSKRLAWLMLPSGFRRSRAQVSCAQAVVVDRVKVWCECSAWCGHRLVVMFERGPWVMQQGPVLESSLRANIRLMYSTVPFCQVKCQDIGAIGSVAFVAAKVTVHVLSPDTGTSLLCERL